MESPMGLLQVGSGGAGQRPTEHQSQTGDGGNGGVVRWWYPTGTTRTNKPVGRCGVNTVVGIKII